MKGITPVIAIILLLLITVAVISFAFEHISKIIKSSEESADKQLEQITDMLAKAIRIDSASSTSLTIRNIGSVRIQATEIGVFVDNAPATCSLSGSMAPGETLSCADLAPPCPDGTPIKVTSPTGSDKGTCPVYF